MVYLKDFTHKDSLGHKRRSVNVSESLTSEYEKSSGDG